MKYIALVITMNINTFENICAFSSIELAMKYVKACHKINRPARLYSQYMICVDEFSRIAEKGFSQSDIEDETE